MKKVNSSRGKTRAQIEAESLERRTRMLDYIRRHDELELDAIISALGLTRATANQWLYGMVETGHVILRQTDSTEGYRRNRWSAGANTAPLEKFRRDCLDFTRKDPVIHRIRSDAKQIGMQRDPLVAALFGQAQNLQGVA